MNEGIAQQLFKERGYRLPHTMAPSAVGQWPLLEECVRKKLLPYVDYALAKALLKGATNATEGAAAVLCHLSLCARQGHLCISVHDEVVEPSPLLSWAAAAEDDLPAADEVAHLLEDVCRRIVEGAAVGIEGVYRCGDLLYLQKYWAYEEAFIKQFSRLRDSPPARHVDRAWIQSETEALVRRGILLPAQAAAVVAASSHSLTLLTGGPGTGKTYTAAHLIKLLREGTHTQGELEIALAAPTGKAAAHLQASLQRLEADREGAPLKAVTLHALLGIKGSQYQSEAPAKLSADLLLVDESSMIDVKVMMRLFAAVKPGARLVLLGDRYQLPPVDAGSLYADMITLFDQAKSPALVELTACMRTEREELVAFADAVKGGRIDSASALLSGTSASESLRRLDFDEPSLHSQLINYVKPLFGAHGNGSSADLLQSFNRFRVLTPLRRGPCGVEELNKLFEKAFDEAVVPIIILQNDARTDLYNGETGVLVKDAAGAYALFPARMAGAAPRKVAAVLLPRYELAYCLSVHKSQGSEFDHVLMMVPPGSEYFGREVFYTAATRARQRLDVWGDRQVIAATLAARAQRLSGLGIKCR